MRQIYPKLTDEIKKITSPKTIGKDEGYPINTFRELVEHTAKLAYKNKDYILFYRGQSTDHKNKNNYSSFYPSIYRSKYLKEEELTQRFKMLKYASKLLVEELKNNNIEGYNEIARKKYVQWSILQHYEVIETPLIDVTQSLRVACSFATHNNKNNDKSAYVYVFGLPYYSNRITINSEHDLINIRLLSISQPQALRPYFQEGYLIGTTDIMNEFKSTELDLNQRLFAKFKIKNIDDFWDKEFTAIPKSAIYPDNDDIEKICNKIKEKLKSNEK